MSSRHEGDGAADEAQSVRRETNNRKKKEEKEWWIRICKQKEQPNLWEKADKKLVNLGVTVFHKTFWKASYCKKSKAINLHWFWKASFRQSWPFCDHFSHLHLPPSFVAVVSVILDGAHLVPLCKYCPSRIWLKAFLNYVKLLPCKDLNSWMQLSRESIQTHTLLNRILNKSKFLCQYKEHEQYCEACTRDSYSVINEYVS